MPPAGSSPDSNASNSSESWDHVDRPSPDPSLPAFYSGRTRQLSGPVAMSVQPHDPSTSRRRGGASAAAAAPSSSTSTPGIAPSEDQYGGKDELSTDDSKHKLGRHGGEAEKWAALLPKQPSRQPTAPGRTRPGLHGVVRRARAAMATRTELFRCSQIDVIRLNSDLIPLFVYSVLALLTRLWQIGKSNTVVWDEAHFGKFGAVRRSALCRRTVAHDRAVLHQSNSASSESAGPRADGGRSSTLTSIRRSARCSSAWPAP